MKKIILLSAFLAVSVFACKKTDETASTKSEQETLKESSQAESTYNDAMSTAEDALSGSLDERYGGRVEGCATVKLDLQKQQAVVDFGTGCKGKDGRTRKGKIMITFKGTEFKESNERIVTFQEYAVNNYIISGTIKQYGFKLLNGKIQYSQSVENGQIKFEDGKTLTISLNRTVEWSEGLNTPLDPKDDVYRVQGNSTGVNKEGKSFTNTITSPLIFKASCFLEGNYYPVSGKTELTVGTNKATVDYGTGTCDKKASMTLLGQTIQIDLP